MIQAGGLRDEEFTADAEAFGVTAQTIVPVFLDRYAEAPELAASLLVALAAAATALAEPGGPDGANSQAHFFDCTGPAGTPTNFDAVSQHRGAAWHLTDSRLIFNALIGFDETTNTLVVLTPGFELNAAPKVTCRSVRPDTGHVFLLTGVLT